MHRRQVVAGLLAAPMVMSFARTGNASTEWDLYIVTGLSSPIAGYLQQFADEVKQKSEGELVINVRLSGELPFKPNEMVRITSQGQVQLGEAIALFNSGTIPLLGVGGLPMLLGDVEDLKKAQPIIEKYIKPELDKIGVKVLFSYTWPSQNIFGSGDPIRSLADFKGRKLRTLGPQQAIMLERLGASSVTMTTPEVAVALERGTVEGVFTASLSVKGNRWEEFIHWGYLPNATAGDDYVLVNMEAYNALSPKARTALDEVAAVWGPKITDGFTELDRASFDELRKEYNVDLFFPPEDQIAELEKLMQDSWDEWAQQTGPDAVAMLAEIRAAIGK
ncbi:MAG: TRAP transporter substrate-binding protein [Hyphomicrobiaceae bacterium]